MDIFPFFSRCRTGVRIQINHSDANAAFCGESCNFVVNKKQIQTQWSFYIYAAYVGMPITFLFVSTYDMQWCRNWGAGGPLAPQYLADQLTQFQPGRADYPHLSLLAPPMFFTFRHHCHMINYSCFDNN